MNSDLPKEAQNRKELILVVEDHPINQQVALLVLDQLGFQAQIAANGMEAVEALTRVPYDLIFMDVQMPKMDGFSATSEIRKMETKTGRHVPIIAMTANAIEGSREECLDAGMDDYLTKPLTPKLLRQMIDTWLPASEQLQTKQIDASADLRLAEMNQRYSADRVPGLIAMFLNYAPEEMTKIADAITSQDAKKLMNTAHELKGASMIVLASDISDFCLALEQSGRENNWHAAAQALIGLRTAVENFTGKARKAGLA
jgi:CheY-like chemotaxis protein/HPt (histidine-containing phosphotransfer) domain-containing protein